MDFNEQKRVFLDLLDKSSISEDGVVNISDSVLLENNLGNKTFWEITCPTLEKEGLIISFDNPDNMASGFNNHVSSNQKYKKLLRNKMLLLEDRVGYARTASRLDAQGFRGSSNITIDSIDKAVKEMDAQIEGIEKELRKGFYHTFVINIDKLLTQNKTESIGKCYFDNKLSTLIINNENIKFRKFTEQYHTLRIIFANHSEVGKEWFFSEIGEKMDSVKKYTDMDFHNYISAIKRRISAETGIKDFFTTTTQSVQINEKYLK